MSPLRDACASMNERYLSATKKTVKMTRSNLAHALAQPANCEVRCLKHEHEREAHVSEASNRGPTRLHNLHVYVQAQSINGAHVSEESVEVRQVIKVRHTTHPALARRGTSIVRSAHHSVCCAFIQK